MNIVVVDPHCARCGVSQPEGTWDLFLTFAYGNYGITTICKNQKECVERQEANRGDGD